MGVGIVYQYKSGKFGIVNMKGQIIVPIRYDSIEFFSKTLFRAKLNGWMKPVFFT